MKIIKVLLVASALLFILGIFLHNFSYSQTPEPPRAMWVWDTKIPTSSEASQRLVDFCKLKNINLLYLSAFNFNENAKNSYRFFNVFAHKNNIKIHALAGDPRWCIERYHKQPLGWLKEVLEYNKLSRLEERFDGIHYDAEPYVLGKVWEENKQMLLKYYLDLNQKMTDFLDVEGEKIILGADIPFWYDDDISMHVEWNGSIKPASYHVLDTIDTITIMDYRNFAEGPNGSIALAKLEIEYADGIGKNVYIGQETKPDVYPEYTTFGNMDEETMEEEIKKVVDTYINHPGFAGIAIHHYESYKKLAGK